MGPHNLDDLIMDDEPEVKKSTSKLKSILSKVAVVIILLIVGVVINKLVMSDKGDPVETVKEKELQEIIDPSNTDPEIQNATKNGDFYEGNEVKERQQVNNNSNRRSNNDNFGNNLVDDELEPMDNVETYTNTNSNKQRKEPKMKEEDEVSLDSNFDFGADYGADDIDSNPVQSDMAIAPQTNVVRKPAQNDFVDREEPRVVRKPKPKPKPKPVRTERSRVKLQKPPSGAYYIQIVALSKKPSDKYLKNIESKGYRVFVVYSGRFYRVRVGPYKTRDEAKSHIETVNKEFRTKAIVIKGK
jgi:cell division septation protein DedD